MSFLKRLFGAGSNAETPAQSQRGSEAYEGFIIQPDPMPESGGQFRLAAVISKTVGTDKKSHRLIRADLFPSEDAAATAALRKAKQVIDEQGDDLF